MATANWVVFNDTWEVQPAPGMTLTSPTPKAAVPLLGGELQKFVLTFTNDIATSTSKTTSPSQVAGFHAKLVRENTAGSNDNCVSEPAGTEAEEYGSATTTRVVGATKKELEFYLTVPHAAGRYGAVRAGAAVGGGFDVVVPPRGGGVRVHGGGQRGAVVRDPGEPADEPGAVDGAADPVRAREERGRVRPRGEPGDVQHGQRGGRGEGGGGDLGVQRRGHDVGAEPVGGVDARRGGGGRGGGADGPGPRGR
eukprot:Sspe_Gene.2646::Locus_884_Transcript_1_1_Confidence_1.000_Length_3826::g.2646::m.2646